MTTSPHPRRETTPSNKMRVVQRRTNLYLHTYVIIDHPQMGDVLVPVHHTMWGRSKYLPHFGMKERIKVLKSMGVKVPIDILLEPK